jgi:hypothetical protein
MIIIKNILVKIKLSYWEDIDLHYWCQYFVIALGEVPNGSILTRDKDVVTYLVALFYFGCSEIASGSLLPRQ